MHPSNNLLLPILRKHGDRLLKAQIEAMVKELSWEDQELFLRRQLDASVGEIKEKLSRSYPDYVFLTEWQPEILRTSLKSWVFDMQGFENYLIGIEDFTLTVTHVELGKPSHLVGYSPQTQAEIRIDKNEVIRNNYRVVSRPRAPKATNRFTNNSIEDHIQFIRGAGPESPNLPDYLLTLLYGKFTG